MGNCPQSSNSYKVTQEGWCSKFGKVQYITDQQQNGFEGFRVVFDGKIVEKIYLPWQEIVKQLQQDKQICEFLILPVSYKWNKEDHLCRIQQQNASSYEVIYSVQKVIYNKFYTTFSNELKQRIQNKAHFYQRQIWYIAYILIRVSSYFQERGWYLGNIHPKNIIVDEKGRIKLFTLFSSPIQQQSYDQLKQSKYNDAYLAPQQTLLYKSSQQNFIDNNKIDSYCIGLVLLSLISIKDLYFVFNHYDLSIKVNVLSEMLLKIKQRKQYSFPLYSMVKSLLELNPLQRKTPSQFYQILKKYQNSLLEMKQFELDEIQQFSSIQNFKSNKKKRYLKEITFLALSEKYIEQAKKTQIKVTQFIDKQMDTNKKDRGPNFQNYQ